MQRLQLYRPNKENTGCALSFGFGASKKSNEVNLYVGAIKQASWDAATGNGSFKANAKNPEKTVNVKMSDWEVGGLIAALTGVDRFTAYHENSFAKTVTTMTVSAYIPLKVKDSKGQWVENTEQIQRGFSVYINRDKTLEFKAAISFGEAATIVEFLRVGIQEKFMTTSDYPQEGGDTDQPAENAPPAQAQTRQQAPAKQQASRAPAKQAAPPPPQADSSNFGDDEDVPF